MPFWTHGSIVKHYGESDNSFTSVSLHNAMLMNKTTINIRVAFNFLVKHYKWKIIILRDHDEQFYNSRKIEFYSTSLIAEQSMITDKVKIDVYIITIDENHCDLYHIVWY